MSNTQTVPIADLEAAFEKAIPCGGVRHLLRPCDKEAVVAWTNPHQCCCDVAGVPQRFKCVDCWLLLYQLLADGLARDKGLRCKFCNRVFRDVLSFTDYRPF